MKYSVIKKARKQHDQAKTAEANDYARTARGHELRDACAELLRERKTVPEVLAMIRTDLEAAVVFMGNLPSDVPGTTEGGKSRMCELASQLADRIKRWYDEGKPEGLPN